ncbi:MAG: pyocin knob domain-containing protein [Butyricicoccus sp.]
MAQKTPNYNLNKPGYEDFGDVDMLNENFEKIDKVLAATDPTKITAKDEPADGDGVMIADSADGSKAKRLLWSNVKAALGKLFVPLARKINGKALSADVTLTAADIKMPDEEDVGAAMAKRAVGTGILGDEIDLNDVDTSGMFRVQKPKNGVYDYGQLLVVHGYGDTIAQVCFDYAANRCAVRCARGLYGASPKWEDWTAIALCAAPEVHELPLVDNITSNNIVYYKNQEGIVTIVGSVAGDFPASQSTVIGNVPEGFRPAYMIEVPAAFTMGATGNASVDASGHVSVAPYLGGLRYAYVAFSYPTG